MNKNEIGTIIAHQLDHKVTKKDIALTLNAFIEVVKETLLKDKTITLEGFMTFSTLRIDEKQGTCFGRNWRTPQKYIPTVKYSQSLKDLIASKKT